jgi:hypothetical protein
MDPLFYNVYGFLFGFVNAVWNKHVHAYNESTIAFCARY